MNEAMNDTILYYPTPLEQAYSLYIIQQVFMLAPTMPVRIPGRNAVPFLTQSGVNRMTLRSIWTAADPQNIGTLTMLTQFQLLLRLISMAQFGILDAEGTAESMREAVQQHSAMRLALPIFSSVVIPPHENLMAMYGMFVIQYPSSAMPMPTEFSTFGGVTSVPSFGSTVSVDDAFSDLGPTENAPLPTLGEVSTIAPPSETLPQTEILPDGVGQGDIAGSATAPNTFADDNEDEFGDFEAVPAIPDPAADPSPAFVQSSGPSSDTIGDQFAGQQHTNAEMFANADGYQTSLPEPAWQQHDGGTFGHTSASGQVGTLVQPGISIHDNDNNQWAVSDAPQSITDAFGDLAIEDAPLPVLTVSQSGSGDGSLPVGNDDDKEEEDDHFGDFEAAVITPSDEQAGGIPHPMADPNDPFSVIEQGPTIALDSLQGNSMVPTFGSNHLTFGEFAPLPNSGAISTEIKPTLSENDDGDDFGGFAEAPVSQREIAPENATPSDQLPQMDAFSHVPENTHSFDAWPQNEMAASGSVMPPTPSFNYSANPSDAITPVDDDPFAAFDAIAPTPQLELPPLTATLSSDSGYNQAPLPTSEERKEEDADEDDFGDFVTPEEVAIAPLPPSGDVPTDSAVSEESKQEEGDDDGFGEFETSNKDVAINLHQPTESKEEDHSFGDFLSPSNTPSMFGGEQVEQLFSPTETMNPVSPGVDLFGAAFEDPSPGKVDASSSLDEFGSFEAPMSAPSLMTNTDDFLTGFDVAPTPTVTGTVNELGALGSAAPTNEGEDDWGDFNLAPTNTTIVDPDSTEPAQKSVETEDDWGDFNLAPTTTTNIQHDFAEQPPQQALVTEDDWGDFDAAPGQADLGGTQSLADTGSQPGASSQNDGDWGTFDAFPASTNDIANKAPGETVSSEMSTRDPFQGDTSNFQSAEQAGNDTFEDDWGDFEDVGSAAIATPSTHPMQQRIRGLAMPLVETILRKSDVNGGHVDLGECFEVHIGLSTPLDPTRTKRVERCIQILEILSKMNHKHGSMYWDQVMNVIRDELVNGCTLINEAKSLPTKELSRASKPLQTMILGLREFVRVARSIIATLGDLLLLDPKALLTVDTLSSSWCSLRILQVGLEIESAWKSIVQESKSLFPSLGDDVEAPSIVEIRSSVLDILQNGDLCELTLQPLLSTNKATTKAAVQWNGKRFMACSGNLLANRCSFYAP